jgi:hypothetical protein
MSKYEKKGGKKLLSLNKPTELFPKKIFCSLNRPMGLFPGKDGTLVNFGWSVFL